MIDLSYGKYASNMNEVRLNIWRMQHQWKWSGYGLWVTEYKLWNPDMVVLGFKILKNPKRAMIIAYPRQA